MPPPEEPPPVAGAKLAPVGAPDGIGCGSGACQRGAGFRAARESGSPDSADRPAVDAIVDDLLVFSADGAKDERVIALKCATGEVAWQSVRNIDPPKTFAFCTPLAIEINGKTQIVSPGAGMVGGYDPATGKEIWRVTYDGYSVIPRPVFGHGLLFISTGYDSPTVLAIRPDGPGVPRPDRRRD